MFILMAFNGPLSPTIASLYTDGKRQELQRILIETARVCLLVSAIATIGLLSLGKQYLMIFGPKFVALNFLLIPRYGVSGVAITTTYRALLSGVVNTIWVYIKVGVHPNILGLNQS